MAALEQQEGDEGRGREWMARTLNARRDPAWTADGLVSDHWLPVSPVTGRLDAFEWRDPLAGVDHTGATIDAEQRALLDAPRAPPPPLATALPAADPPAAVAPVGKICKSPRRRRSHPPPRPRTSPISTPAARTPRRCRRPTSRRTMRRARRR